MNKDREINYLQLDILKGMHSSSKWTKSKTIKDEEGVVKKQQ
jgi:hypothetical protein